jgi:O-antigen ligase
MTLPANLLWDNHKNKKDNIFNLLCLFLIVSTFFTNLIYIRHVGAKVQITEIAFLLLLPFVPYSKVWQYQVTNNLTFIKLVLAYLALDTLSSVLSHQISAIAESMGRCYLFTIFLFLSYWLNAFDTKSLSRLVSKTFIVATLLVGLVAVYGYLGLILHYRSRHLMYFAHYPYFGQLYRLRVGAIYPSLFISVITIPLIFLIGAGQRASLKMPARVAIVILLICTALTLSKSILLITMCLIALGLFSFKKLNAIMLLIITVVFTVAITFFTHFIIVKHNSAEEQRLYSTIYTSNRIFCSVSGYDLLETDYMTVKRTEIDAAKKTLILGVGTGNFNNLVGQYKHRGLFPLKLNNLDPHCTYLGTLVEGGLPALLVLLTILGYIFRSFTSRTDLFTNRITLSLFLIYITFLIDGISTDILNFRHLWVFMALVIVYLQKTKTDNENIAPSANPSSTA